MNDISIEGVLGRVTGPPEAVAAFYHSIMTGVSGPNSQIPSRLQGGAAVLPTGEETFRALLGKVRNFLDWAKPNLRSWLAALAAAPDGLTEEELAERVEGEAGSIGGYLTAVTRNAQRAGLTQEDVLSKNGKPKTYRLTPSFLEAYRQLTAK